MAYYSHEENEKEKRINLDLIPENRGNALLRLIAHKQRITRHFNRHVKRRHLQIGDFVLHKIEATGQITEKCKLRANWDGSFRIIRIIKPGTFELEDMEFITNYQAFHRASLS